MCLKFRTKKNWRRFYYSTYNNFLFFLNCILTIFPSLSLPSSFYSNCLPPSFSRLTPFHLSLTSLTKSFPFDIFLHLFRNIIKKVSKWGSWGKCSEIDILVKIIISVVKMIEISEEFLRNYILFINMCPQGGFFLCCEREFWDIL